MTRTRISTLLVLAVFGAGAGFLVQVALASAGLQRFRVEYPLAISLVFLAAAVIVLAVPIRRATRAAVRTRIDPFHATRVVLFAKASALAGAIIAGAASGILLELLVRAGSYTTDNLLRVVAALVGALILLAAGLVGEWLCTVPPDDDDRGAPPVPGTLEP